jgi:hypothetical protein
LLQLGKKAARRAKRKTDLDKEFEEAEAGPDLAQLALLQSQMLEVCMRRCRALLCVVLEVADIMMLSWMR